MISPELIRRFPFFGFLDDAAIKAVAIITEEISFEKDQVILEKGLPADALYFVIQGSVSYYYVITTENQPSYHKEYFISDIDYGEIFGISALIDPFIYTATVRANENCQVIKIDAKSLRALCEVDHHLAYGLIRETAKAAMERLQSTRVLLIGART